MSGTVLPASVVWPDNPEQKAIEAKVVEMTEILLDAMRDQQRMLSERGLSEPPQS